jgi:hypothetical protein
MSRILRKLLGVRSWGGQVRSRIVRSRVTDFVGWGRHEFCGFVCGMAQAVRGIWGLGEW